jgi:hypothetical protein
MFQPRRLRTWSPSSVAAIARNPTPAGITPAPIADAGYLDSLDLPSETFTVVGYGRF